jgi:porin
MKRSNQFTTLIVVMWVVFACSTVFFADDACAEDPATSNAEPVAARGILPVPDYSGSLFERSHLLGDPGGHRSALANKGVTFDIDYNQYFQSVVDGGHETTSRYGGTIDYNLNIDLDRMGVVPGGLIQMRAVSRYGHSVNEYAGAYTPVNLDATHSTSADDEIDIALPAINYTQFLSEKLALSVGKFVTFDQPNDFSGGSGRSQFWNINLAAPVTPALTVPYSTLGAAVTLLPVPDLTVVLMAATITDTSNHSGFDYLDDGKFGLFKIIYQYELGKLPGGFCNQFGYGWDSDFMNVNSRLIVESDGLSPTTENSTWFNSFDLWQYLWVEKQSDQKVNVNDGRQDLEGIGIFSRIQHADKDTNPIDYTISFGVSAKGLIPDRDNDVLGVGYSYTRRQKLRFAGVAGVEDDASGWELFYNIEVTPAIHWTLDAQVIDAGRQDMDTSVLLGTSVQMRF